MAKYKVEICGINTSNIKVLSSSEMEKLFSDMKHGDKKARELLVNGNLKLILSILKQFNGRYDNMDDLFQIGCVGLLKAIDNFDLSFGVKFSTYCVPMVLGEIKRYLRDNNSIRVSRSVKDLAYKTLKYKDEILSKTGIEPEVEEIAQHLEVSPFEIINSLEAIRPTISLFEPIYSDGGDTIYLFDQIEDKNLSLDIDTKMSKDKAIENLSDREKYIIEQRFIIGKTQMEIAKELSISQAQISRLEKSALSRVRKQM